MATTMTFDGPCPFLTCLEPAAHEHPICPECEAVRFGNLFCPTCWREHQLECQAPAGQCAWPQPWVEATPL